MKASEHGKYPWFFYLFVCLAAITAFGGLLILTACMKRYDATYSAASFVGSFVVSASIMSATHYNTFNYLKSIWNYMLYPTGLVVLMVGVCILVRESKDTDEDDESQTPVRKDSEDLQVCTQMLNLVRHHSFSIRSHLTALVTVCLPKS